MRLADVHKRNALFRNAMAAFESGSYAKAEELLQRFLEVAPGDRNARQLLSTANRAKHNRASDRALQLQRERFKEWRLDMKETIIPYHKILNWPSQEHWDRITELRKSAGEITKTEAESPETASTRSGRRRDSLRRGPPGSGRRPRAALRRDRRRTDSPRRAAPDAGRRRGDRRRGDRRR